MQKTIQLLCLITMALLVAFCSKESKPSNDGYSPQTGELVLHSTDLLLTAQPSALRKDAPIIPAFLDSKDTQAWAKGFTIGDAQNPATPSQMGYELNIGLDTAGLAKVGIGEDVKIVNITAKVLDAQGNILAEQTYIDEGNYVSHNLFVINGLFFPNVFKAEYAGRPIQLSLSYPPTIKDFTYNGEKITKVTILDLTPMTFIVS